MQFPAEPDVGDVPLVCDASCDFLSRPVAVRSYGMLFACAQKNAGPAGVTIVIIRDDLLAKAPKDLPSMLNYPVLAENKSLLNTPPTFAIYMVKLVTDWLLERDRRAGEDGRDQPPQGGHALRRRSTAPAASISPMPRRPAARS